MSALKLLLSRMNGLVLSLLLHGGVALLACVSVFSVQLGGGSGHGSGGSMGNGPIAETYAASVRSSDEQAISGTVLPDVPLYSPLTTEDTALDPVTEELPTPSTPVDIFSVGSSEPPAPPTPPSLADPLLARPDAHDGRTQKLPAGLEDHPQDSEGSTGSSGSGGGNEGGNGQGDGSGDGNATGVYTPSPPYPSEARRRNIEGSVLVELAIAGDGSCAVRRIVESSGFQQLDEAVEKTVVQWKYRSADADGRSDSITKRLRFTFRLSR